MSLWVCIFVKQKNLNQKNKVMTSIELKNVLIEQIAQINDIQFLEAIKLMIDSQTTSAVIELSDFQKQRINESREQIKNGEFIDHEDLNKKVERWLNSK
jgi:predicted transcriptional regulator